MFGAGSLVGVCVGEGGMRLWEREVEGLGRYLVSPERDCLVLLIRTTQTSEWRRAVTRQHKADGLGCKRPSVHTYTL